MVPGANAASIMDRLRVKQYRPWNDISRLLRQLAGEKHLFVDTEERSQLQRCLDLLQKSIKINSAQGMIERLDTITRQLGLKLTKDQKRSAERKPVELFEVFISSDMFYVEVVVESNGHVCDVKVAHHGDPVSCPELCQVLQENDFVTFTAHLEGLIAIYQLNCEKSRKQKAYVALQALESDLSRVAELQSFLNDPRQLVCKSPVGILQLRRGGFPMQLTFFVSPYDLIDSIKSAPGSGTLIPFTVENVLNRKLGQSVSISIENSGQHKLQTGSLITNTDGKMPNFGPLTQLNSVSLPACFTMKLAAPMPLDSECIKKIQKVTGIEIPNSQVVNSLIELITKRKQVAYFVKLPDQDHTYHMNGGQRKGAMISSIPFTHPTHVPPVLEFLRQQSLFNSLISSCVRDQPTAAPQSHVFEVRASSLTSLCVSFEHPLDNESLVTLEISLVDILGLKCKAYFCSQLSELNQFLNEDAAAKVLQQSFSIPVLMRSILKKAKGGSSKPLEELQSKTISTPSFLSGAPSSDVKRDHFDGENVPSFGDNNGPGSMQQDLFDLENISNLQGGLTLNMLADDGPAPLSAGRQNPYQQPSGGAANGSGGPGSQLQRKRPREDGDFLDNRPLGFPLGATGGPTTKGQLESINNNSGDNQQQSGGQQPQQAQPLQSSTTKSVGDQLGTQIKRQRTDGPMEDSGIAMLATGGLNNARDSKNLRAGGDSGESPPAKTPIPSNTTSSGATGGNAGSSNPGGGNISSSAGSTGGSSSTFHGIGASSASGSQQQQFVSRKDKSSSSSSSGTSSKSDDKRNSSSSSSSSRDKEKRKDKDKSYSKDGSSKSSSSKSSSKDKDHKTSSKSSSSKDKDKEKDKEKSSSSGGSSSRGSSSSGLSTAGEKVTQSGLSMAKFSSSSDVGGGSTASPSKYGASSSSSSSSEGQQFTVKSSSSAQGIKLTINKARTSESGGGGGSSRLGSSSSSSSGAGGGSAGSTGGGSGGSNSGGCTSGSGSSSGSSSSGSSSSKASFSASSSSSSSSSKHNRDSPKPRSLSSSPSHKTKVSPSWKASPKHSCSSGSSGGGSGGSSSGMIMPPPADVLGNSSVDLVEQRLRALHGDDSPSLTVSVGASVGVGVAGAGSLFDSRNPTGGPMGPPSAANSSLNSISRPTPILTEDELMDEASCGVRNHV